MMKPKLLLPTLLYGAIFSALGIIMALHSHHSNFDFSVFQMYRIVFNNLHFPELTAWNAMTHPGDAEQLHLYSTLFAPAYVWCMTIWSHLFGAEVVSLRVGSVLFYFPLLLAGSLSLCRSCGGTPLYWGTIFFSGPLLISHSISCDWIVPSLGLSMLAMAELLKERPSHRKLALWCFLSVFFQFLNALHLVMFCCINLMWQGFLCRDQFLTRKHLLSISTACLCALAVAFACYEQADDSIMSFFQYFSQRGEQAILEPQGLSFFFFTLERVWGHMTYNFPLFLIFTFAFGAVMAGPPSRSRQCLLTAVVTHFLYCSFLMGTTAAHYFYSFFYLMLTPALGALALQQQKRQGWGEKSLLILCLLPFCALCLYELKKTGFWTPNPRPLDQFIERGIQPSDLLVREEWYNTWPLNGSNPKNTVYLNPKQHQQETFSQIEAGIIFGYGQTWNSAYHLRPRYQDWQRHSVPEGGSIFYLTEKKHTQFKLVLEDQRTVLHEGLKKYYLYLLYGPNSSPVPSLSSTSSADTTSPIRSDPEIPSGGL
jgi:hypothetical protein